MIKILHCISDMNIGGAGKLLISQIKYIDRKKFDIAVALPKGSMLFEMLSTLGCKIFFIKNSADSSFDIKSIGEFIDIIKDYSPDIVHTHAFLSARIAAYCMRVPSRIYTRHCCFEIPNIIKRTPLKIICGVANSILSTKIIAVAEAARENLQEMGVPNHKIKVIINGVERISMIDEAKKSATKQKYGIEKDEKVISIFARLEDYKGHDTLLDAAKICEERGHPFKFMIVGTGKNENALKTRSSLLGLSSRVIFCGFVNDVSELFSITDINVNCSYGTETSCLALSEGMSIGIPAVATDFGGNTFMVKNGENGICVPTKNASAIADAFENILLNEAKYRQMSRNALERYEKYFTLNAMTEQMEKLYIQEYSRNLKIYNE